MRWSNLVRFAKGSIATEPEAPFAAPRHFDGPENCEFYHTMEIPGLGLVHGQWDLRGYVDQYLGQISLADKRVLEIGPASGFLTIEMEKRGASVVAIEIPDEAEWNFVPYPAAVLDPIYEPRRQHMDRIKNSWWLTHAAFQSKAKIVYTDVYKLPDALGSFDIAVMAMVLLHCHSPLQIIEQCAKRANSLVITEFYNPDLEGKPVCRLYPAPESDDYDTWWFFSTDIIKRFLQVMGFSSFRVSTYMGETMRGPATLFTFTASREITSKVDDASSPR
jgi:O-methyltransferase